LETTGLLTNSGDEARSGIQLDRSGRLAGWLTLVMLAAVLFATLFPFDFSLQLTATKRLGPFLFWLTPVAKEWPGWALNVLFFMPFGCGLAWWMRTRDWSVLRRGFTAVLAGCVLSTAVEYLQLYVPGRSGSWDDVVMNTLGSLAGWLVFEWLGLRVLRLVGEALGELTSTFER
jgi:glycopeptide antibiotics resistance protein